MLVINLKKEDWKMKTYFDEKRYSLDYIRIPSVMEVHGVRPVIMLKSDNPSIERIDIL